MKTQAHVKACTQMFTAAVFTIVRKWKQHKCSTNEQMNEMQNIHIMESRNETLIQATVWRNLETTRVSERIQTQKVHLHELSRVGRFIERESRLIVRRAGMGRQKGSECYMV